MPRRLALLIAAGLLAAAVFAAAAAIGDGHVRPRGNVTLAQARAFGGYPLYYPGPQAAGHKLSAIIRIARTTPARYTEFTFLYGTCEPPRSGGGCTPPVYVILWPACYRYETRYSIPQAERRNVRGVPARLTTRAGFPRLELYAAKTTIVVNGFGLRERGVLAVAAALRGLNTRLPTRQLLPPRPPHAGRTIRCR